MVNADLGACEWFVYELQRSSLIDRGQLDQVVGEFLKRNPRAEPPALAEFLVQQNVLTEFQAERILQGKTQGLVLGPYTLMDGIGTGSMGQVYKSLNKTDNQWYAVKVLPRRSMWNVRLARRQVRAFSQFQHPAVVPFVDVGTSGGMHYLVWPLVDGETLEAYVNRAGHLSVEQTAQIGLQISQGLNVAHQNGLFHGLLKPSNIMIGSDGQAKILDFGIGSLLVENEGESLVDTMSTANALTSGLDCASPESVMEPTNRTPAGDQYSLGCVLYYCLTGRYPFPEGSAVEKMMAHQFKQPTPLTELMPGLPQEIVDLVERLMQKAPENRYAGADEVVEVLQPLAPQVPVIQAATAPRSRPGLRPSDPGTGLRPSDPATKLRPGTGGGTRPGTLRPSDPGTSMKPPPAPPPAPPPFQLPTRESMRGISTPAPGGFAAPDPAAYGNPPQYAPQPTPYSPSGAFPPGYIPDTPPRPTIGPVGFLATLVVTAAIVYFLGMTFLKG